MFAQLLYTLVVNGTAGGTTNPSQGTYTYWSGTPISIAALPNEGYYLDHWELDSFDIGVSNPLNITMDANHTLYGVFRQLSEGHDVAIKHIISKTVVEQGYTSTVKVTAINVGSYSENFNVTLHANTTLIASQAVTVASGKPTIVAFAWNNSGFAKGNYTLSAYASPVSSETNTTDNTLVGGFVIIAMVGDITGPNSWPDAKCDIRDVSLIAKQFGKSVPLAPANCDITNDDKVDIRDIAIVARHFGEIES
jgi:hypothetical protein